MSDNSMLAVVEIPAAASLEETARQLGRAMDGIEFTLDDTGRYEEVPAFVAGDPDEGASFILFGIPEGEEGDAYILEFSAETDVAIPEFQKNAPDFVRHFLCEKDVDASGYLDYSDELAKALNLRGVSAAVPIE
ncbi:hypothetical protein CR152_22725 [Massilia violaceinigra]|uniref:Uncharacterized protein n=1 Tax=Massilia violaceinigra TaxID=2045208 RepID=A0A2D2DPY6_9BURK|nr:hypothetical protein [Massilia violaceinigra]ATQ77013.1 hypothetical protein CR152_22725 [Massilia violaceinigra]